MNVTRDEVQPDTTWTCACGASRVVVKMMPHWQADQVSVASCPSCGDELRVDARVDHENRG